MGHDLRQNEELEEKGCHRVLRCNLLQRDVQKLRDIKRRFALETGGPPCRWHLLQRVGFVGWLLDRLALAGGGVLRRLVVALAADAPVAEAKRF